MPNIFDEETKQALRINMMENGFQLIKKQGMKKTKIIDITRSVNISKGTFYNFFETKEYFVKEITVYKREQMKTFIRAFAADLPAMDRHTFKQLVVQMNQKDFNLLQYLTTHETDTIISRYPDFVPSQAQVDHTFHELMTIIAPDNVHCDWQLVTNYVRIIVMAQSSGEQLIQSALPKNIAAIFDLMLNELYGPA